MHQLTTVEYHLKFNSEELLSVSARYSMATLSRKNSVFHYIHCNNMHVLKKDSTVVFLDSNFSKLMPKHCLDTAVHH